MTAQTSPTFSGFDRNAMGFWHELAVEMNRDWFNDNKQRYQELWASPTDTLLRSVHGKLGAAYAPLTLGEPKILRIYRDVRFAKDKTPYKTHISGGISVANRSVTDGCAAVYFHVGIDEEFIGAGSYQFDPLKVAKWRKAVAGKPGIELEAIIAKLRKAKFTVSGHDDFKKVPKGFAVDHPRAELLKQRGLIAMFPAMPRGLLHEPNLVDWMVKHSKSVVPMVGWLHRHVG
jgi:uncharacterized protein (TIGR02453 family)